jgi:hypothetical protein
VLVVIEARKGGFRELLGRFLSGILAFGAVSVLVSIIIVLMFGAKNLSGTYSRDMLELEDGQPDKARSPKEGVVQPASPR